MLAQFLFYGYDVFKKVKDLSGGEKMRLRLAQLMHEDINLLILDEPTNHLDIEAREVFTKIAWIEQETIYVYEGDYEWARTKHALVLM
ncbi:ABC transporter ATP-binding protein OS=Lysinibacillus sphaericus OX=1421 GN=LS41612_15795 PE=4 SV=1 [Lysinibacillus sphaericus]